MRHTPLSVAALLVAGGMLLTSAAPAARASTTDIESALAAVEASAAAASAEALAAETAARDARHAADTAAARASALGALVVTAESDSAVHSARFAATAARLSRTTSRGPLLAQVLTTADPATLLARLGTLDRARRLSSQLFQSASASANIAQAQRAHAALVQAERERLAAAADDAAARARTEVENETLAVTSAQRELDALYARLAAAQRSTVSQARAERVERTIAGQASSQPSAGVIPTPGAPAIPPPVPAPPAPAEGAPAAPPPPAPPASAPPPAPGHIATPAQAQQIARAAIGGRGWGEDQFSCLVRLWNRESGWRVEARNPSSGAYGIPQAYPAERLAAAGPDWRTNAATQISWGLSYIAARHGSPCGAWDHSQRTGWY